MALLLCGRLVLGLGLAHGFGHVFQPRLLGLILGLFQGFVLAQQLFGAAHPGAFAEDLLHILGVDHLFGVEQLGQPSVSLLVLGEDLLGAGVLFVDDSQHLVVHL